MRVCGWTGVLLCACVRVCVCACVFVCVRWCIHVHVCERVGVWGLIYMFGYECVVRGVCVLTC